MWHMKCGRRWFFYQNVSSLSLTIWEWRCFEDIFTKDELMIQLINDEGVCRTAPAKLGLVTLDPRFLYKIYHIDRGGGGGRLATVGKCQKESWLFFGCLPWAVDILLENNMRLVILHFTLTERLQWTVEQCNGYILHFWNILNDWLTRQNVRNTFVMFMFMFL